MIAGLFSGAGLSEAPPSSLPGGAVFHRRVYEVCLAGAERLAPGVVAPGTVDALCGGHRNVLARLETTFEGSVAGALACLRVPVPNEAQLLSALHLAHGGLHVTINCDDGIERAYALLSGDAELPAEAPECHEELFPAWRACMPRFPPALHVIRDAAAYAAEAFDRRPLLVRLHGGIGCGADGIVRPSGGGRYEPDVLELGWRRRAALDALVDDGFVIVTGYSGSDLASRTAVLSRLKPGRFAWVAPAVSPEVRRELRALDPRQPVTGRAVTAIRRCLAVRPPDWPARPADAPGFEARFRAWSASLPAQAGAEALAWVLMDAGRHAEAATLLERLCAGTESPRTRLLLADAVARSRAPHDRAASSAAFARTAARGRDAELKAHARSRAVECWVDAARHGRAASRASVPVAIAALAAVPVRRTRPIGALPAIVLATIEGHLDRALRSPVARRLAAAAARVAAASARRTLARTSGPASGRRRLLLGTYAMELSALAALLGGRRSPADALCELEQARRMHEHLGDEEGVVEVLGARALVLLADGARAAALVEFYRACRVHPAPTGVLATVNAVLARSPQGHRAHVARAGIDARAAPARSTLTAASGMAALEAFVRALPKVELHVHLEGSIRPATLAALARRYGDHRLPWSAEGVARWYRFRGYTDFLNAFVLVCDQLRAPEDFATATIELGASLAGQNVRYAEVTVSPLAHILRGIAPSDLFAGLEHGRRHVEATYGTRLHWCAACGTRRGPRAAIEMVEMVLTHRPAGLVSVGLAGQESHASRAGFEAAFALAADAGLHRVVHAGEAAGADSISEAIDVLGAERIGHGIRCLDDPTVVARLRRAGVPLEVCPTSNVSTRVVPSLARHPLPQLLAEDLVVTLGTDDPAMFQTDLCGEYLRVARAFRLSARRLTDLARTGVRCAFLDDRTAQALLGELEAVGRAQRTGRAA
jgi:aminodeoxyfutalosine deaminase